MCEFELRCFPLKSPRFVFRTLLHANFANVLKTRVKYPAYKVFLSVSDGIHDTSTLSAFFPRFPQIFSKLAVAVQRACLSLILLGFTVILFIVFGDGGALAKAKEGKEKILSKKRVPTTDASWEFIPSRLKHTVYCTYLYALRQVVPLPNDHFAVSSKEF